ncbi:antitoxin YezG family protein [Kribbella sp. NBC_01245]|uniref:immunity protein YezG family protein n=1 Tax=Kribbella sp. NBC_01245 TaxID=2903578 RepID=UPI002E2CE6CB|nr:immunity protein YezG family protein [Kribbella sp. NBC_01245]
MDRKFALDDEGQDAAAELRYEMWQADKGTWYNADFSLTRSGGFHAEFDYDNPPFGGDVDADLLLEDQRLLPRTADQLPEWHPAARLDR